jgi:hypothetical protein
LIAIFWATDAIYHEFETIRSQFLNMI